VKPGSESEAGESRRTDPRPLPSALTDEPLWRELDTHALALFLDYDGTLAALASHPDLAMLSQETRDTLRRLAERVFTAIVSGRDRVDVERLVGLREIAYAGCHGLDIVGPHGRAVSHAAPAWITSRMTRIGERLRRTLSDAHGVLVESKAFSVAVHTRQATNEGRTAAAVAVQQIVEADTQLAIGYGKEVVEVLPNIGWDKGTAVSILLAEAQRIQADALPVYIGDDATDEAAFAVVKDRGVGILVNDVPRETKATHTLQDPDEVRRFLGRVLESL